MHIRLHKNLPFVVSEIHFRDHKISLGNVLIDTGSAGTIFSTDKLLSIGIQYEPDDDIYRIRGVGGTEFVFAKSIDRLTVGELLVENFKIEVGLMDYGLELDGIIGMDFLTRVNARIDLGKMEII